MRHTRSLTSSKLCLCISLLVALADGGSSELFYDWTVSYSQRAPLGVDKQVIVINDMFPGPVLNATTNDVVNINIHNELTDPFLMTWNGIQMRRNSWQDGVQETNCPILPGQNWTYSFQLKDQIGSFFYFPSLLLQKAAGGYGAIRVNNRTVIPIPFPKPYKEYDVLIGDWYNANYGVLRASVEDGNSLPLPDGILINGQGPNQASFEFGPGVTYRLRISNVGLKTSLNFRIQEHLMLLVETEGSYTVQQLYDCLDIHVGQSYSVLVAAKNQTNAKSYYMVASSRFTTSEQFGIGIIRYPGSVGDPGVPLPSGPSQSDYEFSIQQARSIRWNLAAGAARPNPQGSFHYGSINVSRTLILENNVTLIGSKRRFTVNGISFLHPDTPLKLVDNFKFKDVFLPGIIRDRPSTTPPPSLGTSVIDAHYHDFYHIVFQNPLSELQTWHIDGYNFFVVGMDWGTWDESKRAGYNMIDAVSRSTIQVYPSSWTAILVQVDNLGMWNLRSQNAENWYLGQELYLRVKSLGQDDSATISARDEAPMPENVIKCGRAAKL
ncbi:PREDICTED: monocopper oxidase-like protein SKU5 [Theobroma cacao]|uniref:Monocopper oxidase-like protein SKU5 n=1 Tax=Theobroma cacao TaxID=3641 RepID=A0AB32WTN0_THECC|nr:PREDICTED: monocopper oxidase-like protein SKU5 [Theobroma cacao]